MMITFPSGGDQGPCNLNLILWHLYTLEGEKTPIDGLLYLEFQWVAFYLVSFSLICCRLNRPSPLKKIIIMPPCENHRP